MLALKQANISINPQTIRRSTGADCQGVKRNPLYSAGNDDAPKRKQILTSRSFGTRLSTLPELRAAVSVFATRSAEKLRSQNLCTQTLCVFIHTSPFAISSKPSYNNAITISLGPAPPQDTNGYVDPHLPWLDCSGYTGQGYEYQRAGVYTARPDAEWDAGSFRYFRMIQTIT